MGDLSRIQEAALKRPVRGETSRYRGVSWHAASRSWRAVVKVKGERFERGNFATQEGAARWYDAEAKAAWGDAAILNFPSEGA